MGLLKYMDPESVRNFGLNKYSGDPVLKGGLPLTVYLSPFSPDLDILVVACQEQCGQEIWYAGKVRVTPEELNTLELSELTRRRIAKMASDQNHVIDRDFMTEELEDVL